MNTHHTNLAELPDNTLVDLTLDIEIPATAIAGIDDIVNSNRADGITVEGIGRNLCQQHLNGPVHWATLQHGFGSFSRGDTPPNPTATTIRLRLASTWRADELRWLLDTNGPTGHTTADHAATLCHQHNPARGYIHWQHLAPVSA